MTTLDNPFEDEFDSLEGIADTISHNLGCPVTIEDDKHRLLAYSSHNQEFTDKARLATIIRRGVPEEVINGLWKAGVIQKLSDSEDPIRVSPIHSVGLGARVAIAVRQRHNLLGYIWLIESTFLGKDEFEYLKKASKAVGIKLLQLRARRKKEIEGHQEFFWRLLAGHVESHESIVESAERLKVTLPPRYSIVILQFNKEISPKTEEQIHYVVSTMQQIQAVLSVIDRNQMILLINTESKELSPDEYCTKFILNMMTRMKERFDNCPETGSSGNNYTMYNKIRNSYLEALAVLQLKERFKDELTASFAYSSLGFYRYLPAIVEQLQNEGYSNTTIQKIREYDARHQTSLLQTLKVFLDYDNNIKQVADVLHVHINTLNYRLKRISEIGEIDLRDPNQKFSLFLDLKLERFLN